MYSPVSVLIVIRDIEAEILFLAEDRHPHSCAGVRCGRFASYRHSNLLSAVN